MSDSTITFIVLGVAVVVFVLDRFPVAIVAVGVALSLWATGVLDLDQALAGFGDPTVVFIASLFVVNEGLDAAGVTSWAGQELLARVGESRTRLIVLTLLLVAFLTALISVNGAVAALVPVVVVMAVRLARSPAQLLLPVAFAAHAGSLLVLTGTPVNVIVADAAADAGVGRFGYFEFALVGVPLLAGTIAIVLLLGERLLADRRARVMPRDFGRHARTLVEQYELDQPAEALLTRRSGAAEVVIPPRSDAIGQKAFPGMVTESGDLVVLAVQRRGEDLGPGETELTAGDTLVLQGAWEALDRRLDEPDLLAVDSPALVRRQGGSARTRGLGGDRRARGHGDPARHGRRAARGRRPARRRRDDPDGRPLDRGGVSRHLVDDRAPRRRHDLALDGHDRDGCCGDAGERARLGRRRGRAARAVARALHPDCRARPADLKHGDGADRDPGRSLGGYGYGRLRQAGADGRDRVGGGGVPDSGGNTCEPDGAGARRPLLVLIGVNGTVAALVPVFWSF